MVYVFASNHYHLLLRVDNARQLSEFMCYLNGNLAKEVARKTRWDDKVWARAEKLRAGDRTVEFPPGSFPPRLPFVEA